MSAKNQPSTAEPALVITHDELLALVAGRIGEVLTPERLEAIALARIDARIGRLTLEEAAPRLGCSNARQLKDKCRKLRIPIRTDLGQKAPFILLADIEAANQRTLHVATIEGASSGTVIRRLEEAA